MAHNSKEAMTSRERVLAAIKGLPVDRVPVMYWLNPHTVCRLLAEYRPGPSRVANGLARCFWRRLERQGILDAGEWTRALPMLFDEYGNQDYALALGADIIVVSPAITSPSTFARTVRRVGGRLRFQGPFGVTMGMGGVYAEVIEPPIRHVRELAGYQLPPLNARQFAVVGKLRRAHPDACLLVEVGSFQQTVSDFIVGTVPYMLALYDNPQEIRDFLRRVADWDIEVVRYAARAGADVLFLADDYGTNNRPRISMAMWEDLVYPHLERIVAAAHDTGVPMMLHSCGYQMPFLDYYVRAGLGALQSFQPKAGNDFAAAYEGYGDRLAFATGIDIQQGESMSPQALRESILENYCTGRRKGRHILAMTHMMQYTMPLDNVRAIFDTVAEIQQGGHG